jgi:hypothetical protein
MKRAALILAVLFTSAAFGQGGFVPLTAQPASIQSSANAIYVRGYWTGNLSGPSTSEISCDRKVCREDAANMTVMEGGAFALSADHKEYAVTSWTTAEVVEVTEGGACHVRSTLRFDLIHGRVFSTSAVVGSSLGPLCDADALKMNLELKDSSLFRRR